MSHRHNTNDDDDDKGLMKVWSFAIIHDNFRETSKYIMQNGELIMPQSHNSP